MLCFLNAGKKSLRRHVTINTSALLLLGG